MMGKIARSVILLVLGACLSLAQRSMTVDQLVSFVDSQIKLKGDDRATADFLQKVKLSQKLDARTIEDLQGRGAGPKTVQALRRLSDDSAELPAPPPPQVKAAPPQPPPPSAAEQKEILAAIREYARNYSKNLPNYICVQTTRRHIDPTVPGYRPVGDEVQETLTFFDQKESYKVEMVNGKSVKNMRHEELGGVVTSGEFGTILAHVFDTETDTKFNWDHWATLRGKRMYVFEYHVPQDQGYSMRHGESKREYTSAYRGLIYADVASKAVMRITLDTVGIPVDFPIHEVHLTLDYKPTLISDREYVLPYHFELVSKEDKADTKNEADYRLYRKFGTESSITFGDAAPIPEDELKEQPAGKR